MNSSEYFAALANWKVVYAQHTVNSRLLKQNLREANKTFDALYRAAPRGRYGSVEWTPELRTASYALNQLQANRIASKVVAKGLLEERQALKDEALAFWLQRKQVAA